MKLISFHKLGKNRGAPRVWLESRRLELLGFPVGGSFLIEKARQCVRLRSVVNGTNRVAKRRAAGGVRPIIDIESHSSLAPLVPWDELKITGEKGLISITPSARAFAIGRQRRSRPPWRTIELFSGGGTLSATIARHCDFELVAGLEIEPRFADVWQSAHRDAVLIQADLRQVHLSEFPDFEVLIAAIPCTSHSMLGRAKKALRGKPEIGDSGDLFLSVTALIAQRLPLACIFENVPSFGTSLAGQLLGFHLQRLGYSVTECVLDPHGQWNEPQDRRRWIMVATLNPGFAIEPPDEPFRGDLSQILDPTSEQDREDAERIAGSIRALTRHQERHRSMGHGFGFSTINERSPRVPTIVRSYHKINLGPFAETPWGLRLLRKHEIEKLMGCEIQCDHYATAVEILGQGVQTRVFDKILDQLSSFLLS